MPYNTEPIAPVSDITGATRLPLARVQKIINADEEIGPCSRNAQFVIAVATELFLQYMVEQVHNVAKAERKPRRNIQYKDVANAVARIDNLEFLTDVVPRTIPYKQAKALVDAKKAAASQKQAAGVNGTQQPGADSSVRPPSRHPDLIHDLTDSHANANGVGAASAAPAAQAAPTTTPTTAPTPAPDAMEIDQAGPSTRHDVPAAEDPTLQLQAEMEARAAAGRERVGGGAGVPGREDAHMQ